MATKKKLTFQEQLDKLEALIRKMEAGGCGLEEAVEQYEEGIGMIAALEKELESAHQRLSVLRRTDSGEEREETLEVQE